MAYSGIVGVGITIPLYMSSIFRGTALAKVDQKGRMVLPGRFRESIGSNGKDGGGLVLTGHPEGFLLLTFLSVYEKLERTVRDMPDSDQLSLFFKQTLIGMADDTVTLDKTGRLMLGAELRGHAGISAEVSVVGMSNHIRIWSKARLDKLYASLRDPSDGQRRLPEGWDGFKV